MNAATRHRLNRRLDALLSVIRANRDERHMEKLMARAGITGETTGEVDKSVLLPVLYWYLVNCKQ